MKNLVSVDQLCQDDVMSLIQQAIAYKKGLKTSLANIHVVNMFYENSTRTRHSFEMAEKRLNMEVMNFDMQFSSVSKGESLYDSVLTMQVLGADIAVIRHENENFHKELEKLDIAIVNAGSGCGEHPTQSLLDMMTIYENFGSFKGLKIAIVGDICHSRVAMSNMKLLKKLGASLYFCGPPEFCDDTLERFGTVCDIDQIIGSVDIVMLLRMQLERHQKQVKYTKQDYHQQFGLTLKRYNQLQKNAIVMHPAPVNRDVEIADALVEASKSRIVTQMTNGVWMRMAVLNWIMEDKSCVSF